MSNQTVIFLRNFNGWRRGDDSIQQPQPGAAGKAIDDACEQIERLERERDEARENAERYRLKTLSQDAEIVRLREARK